MGLYFKTNGKRCIITKYKGNDKKAIIPDRIDGKPVKAIGNKAFYKSDIESIVISDNVTKIGKSAFCNSKLKSFEFPANIEFVDDYALCCCANLEKVTSLRQSLKSVKFGKDVFTGTPFISKDEIAILNNVLIKWNIKYNYSEKGIAYIPYNIDVIAEKAFNDNFFLERVVFPAKHIWIKENSFDKCPRLSEIAFYEVRKDVFKKRPWFAEIFFGDTKKSNNIDDYRNGSYSINYRPAKNSVYLFAEYNAFNGTKLYNNILDKSIVAKYGFREMRKIKFAIIYNNSMRSYNPNGYYVCDYGRINIFGLNFNNIKNEFELVLDLEKYDEMFKDTEHKRTRICYSYSRIILSNNKNDIQVNMDYLLKNKKSVIRNLIVYDDTEIMENLMKWNVISRNNISYAIAKAQQYNCKACEKYLKNIK